MILKCFENNWQLHNGTPKQAAICPWIDEKSQCEWKCDQIHTEILSIHGRGDKQTGVKMDMKGEVLPNKSTKQRNNYKEFMAQLRFLIKCTDYGQCIMEESFFKFAGEEHKTCKRQRMYVSTYDRPDSHRVPLHVLHAVHCSVRICVGVCRGEYRSTLLLSLAA